MYWVGLILVVVLFALLAGQCALVIGYMRRLWRVTPDIATDEQCPPAAVIFCVRGKDPSLPQSIAAVLELDYPSYEVVFVFDSPEDPAFEEVQHLTESSRNCPVSMKWIQSPSGHASLKCDAVIHAIQHLGSKPEIIALVDADTIVCTTWLRELVRPFQDHKVGATTGIRWYESPGGEIGSLVRSVWNTAAIVQMYWYKIPWGGSLAIRRNAILDSEMLQKWSHAFCEDTLVSGELERLGLKVEIVPALHMVNTERCRLDACYSWITRQLLTTRLYHRAWKLVAAHGMATSATLALCVVWFLLAIWFNSFSTVALIFIAMTIYETLSLSMLYGINWIARRILSRAGRPLEKWGGEMSILYVLTLPVTQLIYGAATSRSFFTQRVSWRGVNYTISKNGRISLDHYSPYREADGGEDSEHSL